MGRCALPVPGQGKPGAVERGCPLVLERMHYRTAPFVPPSHARCTKMLREATRNKAPCLAAIGARRGVETIVPSGIVSSHGDVSRNCDMCQTLFSPLTLIM